MKSLLLVLAVCLFVGCGSVKTHDISCQSDSEQIIKTFVSLAMQEGYTITMQDPKSGFAAAEMMGGDVWVGIRKQMWQISIMPASGATSGVIIRATAKENNSFPDDDANRGKSTAWYWNIRDGMEKLCGSKFVVNKAK